MPRMPLETKMVYNYEMKFRGKRRVFSKVIFTVSPFDGGLTISAAEFKRLAAYDESTDQHEHAPRDK